MSYVEDFDLSGVKELRKRLTKVKNSQVNYGWLSKKMHTVHGWKKKVPTAQIMFWNEFGTKQIPARPYLTITSLATQVSGVPYITKYFQDNLNYGYYTNGALHQLATHITSEFKLVKGSGQPLAPYTLNRKKFSDHWRETGQALSEWESKVVDKELKD